ncbi:hypothetical protein [Halodurantibacterium flavum]|uniref:Acyloxyacyl hydrolase n=1 Tax=Halodurantibacterium flavum TaxID=1382802 RepID=A0ABW4RZT0_9RHOB
MKIRGFAFALAAVSVLTQPAAAYDSPMFEESHARSVFAFGGALTRGNMHQSAVAPGVGYERNVVVGLGFQQFPFERGQFALGWEIGGAGRFGGGVTGELWGGAVLRHKGFAVAPDYRLGTAMTVGLSHISSTHRGREQELEARYGGNARTLFYLGPELSLSSTDAPEREIFWRLHHRSGGGRTLGNMYGAANANVIGLRYRF